MAQEKAEQDNSNGSGRRPTSGMFIEEGVDPNAPYSYEVFKRVFLDEKDMSGYKCAQVVIAHLPEADRWTEWCRLFVNTRLAGYLKEWQKELEVQLRATAGQKIAKGCDPKDFTQLKFVFEGKLSGERPKRKAGRPPKGGQTQKQRAATSAKSNAKDHTDKVIAIGERATKA